MKTGVWLDLGRLGCLAASVLVMLTGCASQRDVLAYRTEATPPDFALVVTVSPERTPSGNPAHLRASQHVVEPDGVFRAAVGPGTHPGWLPPVTARLSPDEVDRLWAVARPLWTNDGTPLLGTQDSGVAVEFALTAWDHTRRGRTDAIWVKDLLQQLAILRGDGPAPSTQIQIADP